MKTSDEAKMKTLQDEALDLGLSLLLYFAASGLAFHALLGISPLEDADRNRLFDRLLDEEKWHGQNTPVKRRRRSVG
jgi:hypothetical protein